MAYDYEDDPNNAVIIEIIAPDLKMINGVIHVTRQVIFRDSNQDYVSAVIGGGSTISQSLPLVTMCFMLFHKLITQ